jgi:hypothetical protein
MLVSLTETLRETTIPEIESKLVSVCQRLGSQTNWPNGPRDKRLNHSNRQAAEAKIAEVGEAPLSAFTLDLESLQDFIESQSHQRSSPTFDASAEERDSTVNSTHASRLLQGLVATVFSIPTGLLSNLFNPDNTTIQFWQLSTVVANIANFYDSAILNNITALKNTLNTTINTAVSSLDRSIITVQDELASLRSTVTALDTSLTAAITTQIATLQTLLQNQITTNYNYLNGKTTDLQAVIATHNSTLINLINTQITETTASLTAQIMAAVSPLQAAITPLQTTATQLQTTSTQLQGNITQILVTLTANYNSLTSYTDQQVSALANLQTGNLSSIQTQISLVSTSMRQTQDQLNTLQSSVPTQISQSLNTYNTQTITPVVTRLSTAEGTIENLKTNVDALYASVSAGGGTVQQIIQTTDSTCCANLLSTIRAEDIASILIEISAINTATAQTQQQVNSLQNSIPGEISQSITTFNTQTVTPLVSRLSSAELAITGLQTTTAAIQAIQTQVSPNLTASFAALQAAVFSNLTVWYQNQTQQLTAWQTNTTNFFLNLDTTTNIQLQNSISTGIPLAVQNYMSSTGTNALLAVYTNYTSMFQTGFSTIQNYLAAIQSSLVQSPIRTRSIVSISEASTNSGWNLSGNEYFKVIDISSLGLMVVPSVVVFVSTTPASLAGGNYLSAQALSVTTTSFRIVVYAKAPLAGNESFSLSVYVLI